MTRFLCSRRRRQSDAPDWWTYFGSFGDDCFGDEADDAPVTADASAN